MGASSRLKSRYDGPALIVHGGAGGRAPEAEQPERRRALLQAATAGGAILRDGGRALDAVIEAVRILEDHPLFNAGFGSCLTRDGTIEMDAGIMVAKKDLRNSTPQIEAGGAILVSRVRNPVLLAQLVMERTPHVLMAGRSAEQLARQNGLAMCRMSSLITPRARCRWLAAARRNSPDPAHEHGTVGAAAVDHAGNLAAATSTGGVAGKLCGRIGDSAIPGCGVFADSRAAVSATGVGEVILKLGLARRAAAELVGRTPQAAVTRALAHVADDGNGEAGLILVDRTGRFGYAHNAPAMEIATFHPIAGVRHLSVRSSRA
ncbi:MAG TPA: isoaspartyl peptidase/L-asparaginase [Candidatus Binataceae bacterium]|nr:isoaspartyl peptidase/L-asparaginase [Candidatus Binataceae bacterium]